MLRRGERRLEIGRAVTSTSGSPIFVCGVGSDSSTGAGAGVSGVVALLKPCSPSRGPTTKKPTAANPTGMTSHFSRNLATAPLCLRDIPHDCSRQVFSAPEPMAARVFLDTLELDAERLEALTPQRGGCYPLPPLASTGVFERREFPSLIVENAYVRATFLPMLGGRLWSLFDKRTDRECLLSSPRIETAPVGPRGVWAPAGVQWSIGDAIRPTSLGEVDVRVIEGDEEQPARVVLFELIPGTRLSWHLWIELPPDEPVLRFEMRGFNRGLQSHRYQSGLTLGISPQRTICTQSSLTLVNESGNGLGVQFAPGSASPAVGAMGFAALERHFPGGQLGPRQTDHWRFSILPVSDMAGIVAVSPAGALSLEEGTVRFQAAQRFAGGKVFALTAHTGTLEARQDFHPEAITEIALPREAGAVQAVVIRSAEGDGLLEWPQPEPLQEERGEQGSPWGFDSATPLSTLEKARRDPSHRAAASVELARRAIARGDFAQADEWLEETLLFNADDPLAWADKATALRLMGVEETSGELPNAHFLAPFEPVLRAEAFLSQLEGAPALLAPLAEQPDQLMEAACHLVERGPEEEAARFLAGALEVADLQLLRILRAWVLSGNDLTLAEAGIEVGRVGRQEPLAPLPWRDVEVRAIRDLAKRFPDTPLLEALLALTPDPRPDSSAL